MKGKALLMPVLLMLVCGMIACDKQDESSIVVEESIQTNNSDHEIADRMEDFSVGGYEIGLPCTVGDFMGKFELEYSFPSEFPNTICCSYLIDGEAAGVIFVYSKDGKVHDTDYVYAMSVNEFSIVKELPFAFEVSGITENMTREQIQEIWGEPSRSGTGSIIYCDGKFEDSQYINQITISFDDNSGKINDIAFFVSLDRIEEPENTQ